MNLYFVSQQANDNYDSYDSAVICAESEEAARYRHPTINWEVRWQNDRWEWEINGSWVDYQDSSWTHPDNVSVTLIGVADPSIPAGVVCASFNAG